MKITGIIAEYNPFHNGHRYQYEQIRKTSENSYLIAVMSGSFVQRGEPAVYDKYTRTLAALNAGADLVIELPAAFAVSSAEDFAAAGVALLDQLGVVDELCFGSECGDAAALGQLADILVREPEDYRMLLKTGLSSGMTFPQARTMALREWTSGNRTAADIPAAWDSLLSGPNNILGIEYLKALIKRNSLIKPVTIARSGQGYHGQELETGFASASGIRAALANAVTPHAAFHGEPAQIPQTLQSSPMQLFPELQYSSVREFPESQCSPVQAFPESQCSPVQAFPESQCSPVQAFPTILAAQVPRESIDLYQRSIPVFPDDCSLLLNERLLTLHRDGILFDRFADISEDLADRIEKQRLDFASYTSRITSLKTRQYTYSRISRALLHLMLGIEKSAIAQYRSIGYTPYARILGFRKKSAPLLTALKRSASIPLLTRTAAAEKTLTGLPLEMFLQDLYCTHIYQTIVHQKGGCIRANEYTQPVIVI